MVALIFFATVLTLFDFALYLSSRSVLNSAASKAISLASVISGLDADCQSLDTSAKRTACGAARKTAMGSVITTARNNALGILVRSSAGRMLTDLLAGDGTTPAIEFQIVKSGETYTHRAYRTTGATGTTTYINNGSSSSNWINTGVSLRDVLQSQPMEIHIRATYRSLSPWLPPMTIDAHAAGFREPRFISSYPEYVDCRGQPVAVGVVPGSVGYCPCVYDPGNGTLVEAEDGNCACKGPLVSHGSGHSITCTCPNPNQVADPATGSCACPPANCASNEVINTSTCGCDPCSGFYQSNPDHSSCSSTCPASVLGQGGANCGGNQYFDPASCACLDCAANKLANDDHTSCSCHLNPAVDCGGAQMGDASEGVCRCFSCGNNTTANQDHSACTCNLTASSCPTGTVLEVTSTSCRCVGCGSGQQANADQTACVACTLTGASCSGNTVANNSSCSCVPCGTGSHANNDHSSCECNLSPSSCGSTQYFSYSDCRCHNCSGSAVANDNHSDCTCNLRVSDCGGGQYLDSNACRCRNCPSGQVTNGSGTGCTCTAGNIDSCRGGTLQSNCSCSCPSGESSFSGAGCAPTICCAPGTSGSGCRPCNWGVNGGTVIEGL